MRILVVEDEEPIAAAIEKGLARLGYAVDVAYDGAEALNKAGVNTYDVICLDLNLPRIDGVEVAKQLRENRSDPDFAGAEANHQAAWQQRQEAARAYLATHDDAHLDAFRSANKTLESRTVMFRVCFPSTNAPLS